MEKGEVVQRATGEKRQDAYSESADEGGSELLSVTKDGFQ